MLSVKLNKRSKENVKALDRLLQHSIHVYVCIYVQIDIYVYYTYFRELDATVIAVLRVLNDKQATYSLCNKTLLY